MHRDTERMLRERAGQRARHTASVGATTSVSVPLGVHRPSCASLAVFLEFEIISKYRFFKTHIKTTHSTRAHTNKRTPIKHERTVAKEGGI